MPEKLADKWGSIGSAISVWTKLLIGLFIFIFTVGTAWYQIQTNASENVRQDQQFHEVMETMKREFEIQGQRSDKRYERAMEEATELHGVDKALWQKNKEQDEKILDVYKEVYFIKGQLSNK